MTFMQEVLALIKSTLSDAEKTIVDEVHAAGGSAKTAVDRIEASRRVEVFKIKIKPIEHDLDPSLVAAAEARVENGGSPDAEVAAFESELANRQKEADATAANDAAARFRNSSSKYS